MTSLCPPQLLTSLISTKEFRIIPTPIFRQVQTNPDLPVEAKFLWVVLWELCSPNSHFEKQLTWGFLGKRLGKSESSIRRWAKSLIKFGYLEIKELFSADGSQLPSKFRIGVPAKVAKQVWETAPDRFKVGVSDKKPACETKQKGKEVKSGVIETAESDTPETESNAGVDNAQAKSELKSGVHEQVADISLETPASTPVIKQNVGANAEFHTDGLKIGGEKGPSRAMSKLLKSVGAVRKGSDSSQVKRSDEISLDVPADYLDALKSAYRAVTCKGENGPKRVGEGDFISAFTRVSKSGTQEKNQQKQDNNNSDPHLANKVKSELMVRLGTGYDFNTLTEQFVMSIEKGAFKKFTFKKAMNIGIKLVKENRWMKPRVAVYG